MLSIVRQSIILDLYINATDVKLVQCPTIFCQTIGRKLSNGSILCYLDCGPRFGHNRKRPIGCESQEPFEYLNKNDFIKKFNISFFIISE